MTKKSQNKGHTIWGAFKTHSNKANLKKTKEDEFKLQNKASVIALLKLFYRGQEKKTEEKEHKAKKKKRQM